MEITKKITVNMESRRLIETVDVVQFDANTRDVELTLMAGDSPWTPPADAVVSVAFEKPDNTAGWYDTLPTGKPACSVAENVVRAILAPEVLTAAGRVMVSVVFQDASLNQLGTFPFSLAVHRQPGAGRAISNSYYNVKNLQQINEAFDAIRAELAQLGQGGGASEETVFSVLVDLGIAPVLLDADGSVLADGDGAVLVNN